MEEGNELAKYSYLAKGGWGLKDEDGGDCSGEDGRWRSGRKTKPDERRRSDGIGRVRRGRERRGSESATGDYERGSEMLIRHKNENEVSGSESGWEGRPWGECGRGGRQESESGRGGGQGSECERGEGRSESGRGGGQGSECERGEGRRSECERGEGRRSECERGEGQGSESESGREGGQGSEEEEEEEEDSTTDTFPDTEEDEYPTTATPLRRFDKNCASNDDLLALFSSVHQHNNNNKTTMKNIHLTLQLMSFMDPLLRQFSSGPPSPRIYQWRRLVYEGLLPLEDTALSGTWPPLTDLDHHRPGSWRLGKKGRGRHFQRCESVESDEEENPSLLRSISSDHEDEVDTKDEPLDIDSGVLGSEYSYKVYWGNEYSYKVYWDEVYWGND
ncbi:hypothetical protein Pcinc_043521 [Petrolisthes cinctipes]|uniref:Uncharacterized protein n=1 Tax=Petrolisthes cinctipes TaxID=88211 RepID=A0AAE1BFS7_PETCI|nr:hypothetical protein Pcinc_043521 [Petrolisthes cinctipes]